MYVFVPNMANAPVKIWGKFSQYALQILDFTLNMPHEILGPVAPPTLKDQEYLLRGVYILASTVCSKLSETAQLYDDLLSMTDYRKLNSKLDEHYVHRYGMDQYKNR